MIPTLLSLSLTALSTQYCQEVAAVIIEAPSSLLSSQEKRQLLSDLPDECLEVGNS